MIAAVKEEVLEKLRMKRMIPSRLSSNMINIPAIIKNPEKSEKPDVEKS